MYCIQKPIRSSAVDRQRATMDGADERTQDIVTKTKRGQSGADANVHALKTGLGTANFPTRPAVRTAQDRAATVVSAAAGRAAK